jgi:hypothetical protein
MPTLEAVFCKFGEVAEAAQLLETELGTLMLHVKGVEHDLYAGHNGELATEIYKEINKSTLGQLLKQVAKPAGFSEDLELLLAKALADRNYLFHSFYRKHNFRKNSEEGRAIMLADLETRHQRILDAWMTILRLQGFDLDRLMNVPLPTQRVKI